MKKTLLLTTCLFLAGCSKQDVSNNLTQYIVPNNEQVAGLALHKYADRWWQWANSMPDSQSPVIDTVGSKCHVNQNGDVWFLAGSYETTKIKRQCSIPQGKYIFFPIVNTYDTPEDNADVTCDEMKANVTQNNLAKMSVKLNGNEISKQSYQLQSQDCFDLYGQVSKAENAPNMYPTVSNGYWMMLKPLPKGEYSLEYTVELTDGFAQDIENKLVIN